jgi:hypothetical protein
MKKSKLFLISALMVFAIAFAACGTSGAKENADKAAVECPHAKKDSECGEAKKDSCNHEKAENAECDHDHEEGHEHGEDCDHN